MIRFLPPGAGARAPDSGGHWIDQNAAGKGFAEAGHAAAVPGVSWSCRPVMGRHEGHRQAGRFLPEPPLQLKTRDSAQLDVRDGEASAVLVRILEEQLRG